MRDTQNWVTATGDSSQRRGGNIGKRKSTLETIFKTGAGQRERERDSTGLWVEKVDRVIHRRMCHRRTTPVGKTDKATMKILL